MSRKNGDAKHQMFRAAKMHSFPCLGLRGYPFPLGSLSATHATQCQEIVPLALASYLLDPLGTLSAPLVLSTSILGELPGHILGTCGGIDLFWQLELAQIPGAT